MKGFVSVVVCTHNRAELLAEALASLVAQTLDPTTYEVIVVDNASTDGTRAVVEGCSSRLPQVRYCLEERLGVSHARNRGWVEARGDYVGYLDDDARATPEWLDVAVQTIADKAPAAFGGPVLPFHTDPKPRWYKDRYELRTRGETARALGPGEHLSGANLFFRRAILEALGGFDPALGVVGRRVAYGEETALQVRIRAEMPGEIIHYEPRLCVDHLVHAWKKTCRGILLAAWVGGRDSSRVLGDPHTRRSRARAAVQVVGQSTAIAAQSMRGVLWRDREAHPYYQNFVYEVVRPRVVILGALCERMRAQ